MNASTESLEMSRHGASTVGRPTSLATFWVTAASSTSSHPGLVSMVQYLTFLLFVALAETGPAPPSTEATGSAFDKGSLVA
jgi:hypothetical protein